MARSMALAKHRRAPLMRRGRPRRKKTPSGDDGGRKLLPGTTVEENSLSPTKEEWPRWPGARLFFFLPPLSLSGNLDVETQNESDTRKRPSWKMWYRARASGPCVTRGDEYIWQEKNQMAFPCSFFSQHVHALVTKGRGSLRSRQGTREEMCRNSRHMQ